MARTAVKDMTQGKPLPLILGFYMPMLFGMLFQQLYNMADTMIVGKCLGVDALAGVGSTSAISFMIIGFCQGVCGGFAIPVAQKFGEKNEGALRKFVANSGWLAAAFSLVMTVAVCLLCRNILVWMDTPEDIFQYAYDYIFVIFLGIPATYLYNLVSGIIRSFGDSTTPLLFLLFSSLLNVGLDFFAILVLDMGVAGAGWATLLAQAISGILCLLYMKKKFEILKMRDGEWKPSRRHMAILCGMGIPMGLQYSITAIGSVILQTAVNGLGAIAVAAFSAGNKLILFFGCPLDALGATMATYGGQNVGARRLDRIREGRRIGAVLGIIYSALSLAVILLFGNVIGLLFLDSSQTEILEMTRQFLLGNTLVFVGLVYVSVLRFLIQGLGYSKLAILAGVCEMFARSFMGFVMVPIVGYWAVCFASPAAWIAADLFLVPAYLHVMKDLEKLFGETKSA